MNTTQKILTSIVDDYKEIGSSNNELIEGCAKIRKSLCVIIKQHLLDVVKISSELGKARDQSSQTQTVLNFLHYLIDDFPHSVFVISTEQCHSAFKEPPLLSEDYLKQYRDFLSLLFSRLFQIIATHDLKPLHEITKKILFLWMQLIKLKNAKIYRQLLINIVDFLLELHNVEETHFSLDEDFKEDGHSIRIEAFRFLTTDFESIPYMTIKSFECLERWQIACSNLLKLHISDVRLLVSHKSKEMWKVIFYQIKYGGFELKTSSMRLAIGFEMHEDAFSNQASEWLLSCVLPMLEYIAAGRDKAPYLEGGICPEEIKTYDETLTEFLCGVFATECIGSEISLSNMPLRTLQLDFSYIKMLSDFLACDINHLYFDKVLVSVCSCVVIRALHHLQHYQGLLPDRFITNCCTLTQWLLQSSVKHPEDPFLHEVVTYFFVFLYYVNKDKVVQPVEKLVMPQTKETHLLSRKRPHEPDASRELFNNMKKTRSFYLMDLVRDFSKGLFEKQDELAELYKSKKVQSFGVLETTQDHLMHLLQVLQPLLMSIIIVRDRPSCTELCSLIYKESLITNVFMKCLESFIYMCVESTKAHEVLKPDVVVKAYGYVVSLAKTFSLCVNVFHDEMQMPQTSEAKRLCDTLALVLSLMWIEDLPSKDLKFGGSHCLSKASMITVCKILRTAKFSEIDINQGNEQKLLIVNDCLCGLANLPSNIATLWRTSILLHWTFSCSSFEVKANGLFFLPLLCTKVKPSSFDFIVAETLGFLKVKKNIHNSFSIIEKLVYIIEPLTLAFVGKCTTCTYLYKKRGTSQSFSLSKKYVLNDASTELSLLDSRKLLLFEEIESVLSKGLFSTEVAHRTGDWEKLLRHYVQSIAVVLNHASIKDSSTRRLLVKWIKYFQCEVAFEDVKLIFTVNTIEEMKILTELFEEHATTILRQALQSKKASVLCNMVHLFSSLMCWCASSSHVESILFSNTMKLLCELFSYVSIQVSTTAFLELEKFAKRFDLSLRDKRKHFCHSIIHFITDANSLSREPVEIMEDASHLFKLSTNEFLKNNLQYLLPPTVVNKGSCSLKKQNDLLTMFSGSCGNTKADIIMQNFKHIFCHAVTSGAHLETLFKFLESQTSLKKESLILMTHGSLVQLLIAHVSVDRERVCKVLQVVHEIISNDKQVLAVSELIKPYFLSVLTYFNSQLRLAAVTFADKKQVYESLICLLYLMDKSDVTAVSVKIVNTICLAQQIFADCSYADLCCKAWNSLVHCVDESCLGGLLSQVTVMLLPYLEHCPSEVARTLEYLTVDQQEHTKDNFGELYFLPNHESLKRVHNHMLKELKRSKSNRNTFMSNLEQATKQLSHDSAEVRQCALVQLRIILQSDQTALQRHILASGPKSELIKRLAVTLLTCCRDSNAQIRTLSAKCLGEIGAIDPDKLSATSNLETAKREVCLCIDDDDFAFDLFNCLVQAFLVAEPIHQDLSAFAIQELLKIFDCKEGARDTPGRHLWRKFSQQTRVVLEPHLSSKYALKNSDTNFSTLKRPILHKKHNLSFREWIGTFTSVLMQMASSSLDKSSKAKGVFDACATVVRNDVNVALFLLPATVVEVLKCGDKHVSFIAEEIMAVLESTEILKNTKNDGKSTTFLSSLSVTSANNQDSHSSKEASSSVASHLSQLSAQAIFSVLDHVTTWHRQPPPSNSGPLARTKHTKEREQAVKLLSRVPQKTLAEASLRCRAHKRALLHYETYMRESCGGKCDDESASILQRIFVEMSETDGVLGVVSVRGVEPNPETQLLALESTGALQDAASCYERLIRSNPDNLLHHKGFLKCLIDLGQLSEVVNLVEGTVDNHPTWKDDLYTYSIEACWRLGQWDLLDNKLEEVSAPCNNWSVGVGKSLAAIKKREWKKFDGLLNGLYQSETEPLSAASMEINSFQRGYDHILRLHILSDLERFASVMSDQSRLSSLDDVMSLWQLRHQTVQPSFRALEPMMSLSRVIIPLLCEEESSEGDRYVGKLWLQSAKLARKSGHLQTAYGALLSAQPHSLPGYCIEHAKWLWKKGESHQALLTLQRGFAEHFTSDSTSRDAEQRLDRAKVMLLEAKLMEESSSFDSNTVLRKYKEVVSYMGEWEDSHFYCGRYYDKLMTTMIGENKASAKSHHLYYIMHHYGRSLCYGTSHIYESLTKLLTLWLDYGSTASKLEKAGRPQSNEDVQRLVEVISDVRSRLPAYVFYVAFSQLTSRICHEHQPTYSQLREILVSVIQAFPQRALWSMMAISKSSFKQRAARCQEIFEKVSHHDRSLSKLISDAIKLTNRLLELCNKPVTSLQVLSISTHFKQLKKLVEGKDFSEIMVPLQKLMNVTLPQHKQHAVLGSQNTHNPFPEPTVHIVGFNDEVEILNSLQRPKKISIRGSNGASCTFLCKPKDDLRKDARLTEFAAIVNKCLKRDPESGKRQLRIRSYAVIPINEECGLIEWVENMKGLRHILLPIYKARGIFCSGKQLKAWQLPQSAPVAKKLEVFRTKLLPRHPPVLHEWFLTTFTDPSSWYNARLAYARSVAVMSVVGYMLGLGDRHGENILFDSHSGEAMHVDFNCLFNKGMHLEVPEIVPFRLTHNMVDAMGPTKYEGFFRKACEVTMNVIREQREPLMSVLKTFIYDPLVEWSKKGRGANTSSSGEILTEKALTHVNDIDKRLRGIPGKNKGLPLSIEGHVHYLIEEATDEEKLCQMYIGWAPFM